MVKEVVLENEVENDKDIKIEVVRQFVKMYFDKNISQEIKDKSLLYFYQLNLKFFRYIEKKSKIKNLKGYKKDDDFEIEYNEYILKELGLFLERHEKHLMVGDLTLNKYLNLFSNYFTFAVKRAFINVKLGSEVVTQSDYWNTYFNAVIAYVDYDNTHREGTVILNDEIHVEDFKQFVIDSGYYTMVYQYGFKTYTPIKDETLMKKINLIFKVINNKIFKVVTNNDDLSEMEKLIDKETCRLDFEDRLIDEIDLKMSLVKIDNNVKNLFEDKFIKNTYSFNKEYYKVFVDYYKGNLSIEDYHEITKAHKKENVEVANMNYSLFNYSFCTIKYKNYEKVVKDYIIHEYAMYFYEIFDKFDFLDLDIIDNYLLSIFKGKSNVVVKNLKEVIEEKYGYGSVKDELFVRLNSDRTNKDIKRMIKDCSKYLIELNNKDFFELI